MREAFFSFSFLHWQGKDSNLGRGVGASPNSVPLLPDHAAWESTVLIQRSFKQ